MQGSSSNPDAPSSSSSSSSRGQTNPTPTQNYLSHNPYSTLVSPHYASGYAYLGQQQPPNANQAFWGHSYATPQAYYSYQQPPNGHLGASLGPPSAPSSGSGAVDPTATQAQSGNAPQQQPPSIPQLQAQQDPPSIPTPLAPNPADTTTTPPQPPKDTPRPVCKHWDATLKAFLERIKFRETLKGFENDFLVLNDAWEREVVYDALVGLVEGLQAVLSRARQDEDDGEDMVVDIETKPTHGGRMSLDERKLECVHLADPTSKPRTPSSVNKDISRFIARTRARNNASNRREFLYSLAEKKQRRQEALAALDSQQVDMRRGDDDDDIPSCARADAKPIDRDAQMKYDIAKNEDGPLSRTMQTGKQAKGKEKEVQDSGSSSLPRDGVEDDKVTADRYPALTERIQNLEGHVAVRYVPSLPRTLFARVKFLEDHIIKLEKEYPPWAALHFNQPHRGWPPPPKATPIIVPPQLRAPVRQTQSSDTPRDMQNQLNGGMGLPSSDGGMSTVSSSNMAAAASAVGTSTRGKSSLYQAVMEKLEVQKAMSDLKQREIKTEF